MCMLKCVFGIDRAWDVEVKEKKVNCLSTSSPMWTELIVISGPKYMP